MMVRMAGAHSRKRLAGMGSSVHDFTSECLIRSLTCLVVKEVKLKKAVLAQGSGKSILTD